MLYLACLSTVSLQSYSYQCAPLRFFHRFLPLFAQGRFHTGASQEKQKEATRSFNSMFRYTDDVLLLNNSRIGDFVVSIYIVELEIKDTTDTATVM